MDSILTSVKKLLGIGEDYTQFDTDIIIHINSVFMILHQLGVGPERPFTIQDSSAVWDDFIENFDNIEAVKSYMYLKVKMLFDQPQSGTSIDAYNNLISELEWRLNISAESKEET